MVTVLQWVGPGKGTEGNNNSLIVVNNQAQVGQNNVGTTGIPSNFVVDGRTEYDTNLFYEGVIDLTNVFKLQGGNSELCQASWVLETRSSKEITADLKDFVGGNFDLAPTLEVSDDEVCEGDEASLTATLSQGNPANYTFTWAPAPVNGNYTGQGTSTITFASPDIGDAGGYTVTATSEIGCNPEGPGNGTLSVNQVTPIAIDDQMICPEVSSVDLTALEPGGQTGGAWTYGANTPVGDATSADPDNAPFTYTYTDGNNCETSDTVDYSYYDSLVLTLNSPEFCEDQPTVNSLASLVTANTTGNNVLFFNFLVDAQNNENNTTTVPTTSQVHNLWALAVSNNGCAIITPFTITINSVPVPVIEPVGTLCSTDEPFDLEANLPGGKWSGTGITDEDAGTFDPSQAVEGENEITYTIETDKKCIGSDKIIIIVESCADYCSYTQGFYGNEGGLGCAPLLEERVNAQTMMIAAVGNSPVYFGDYDGGNGNYFVITPEDVIGDDAKIFDWLPGGGKPKVLNGLYIPPGKNGSIKNTLLAQTITLFFNIELNSAIGDWELLEEFYTSESMGCGTGEAYYKTDTYKISPNVITYLDDNYGGITVAHLLELANDVLGGVVTDISASSVSGAADAINMGFDECRKLRSEPNSDEDSHPDSSDNCIDDPNEDQLDTDQDGIGDVCDDCPFDPNNDEDGDGVCGDVDNCPTTFNPGQNDFDSDGVGDSCDVCEGGDASGDSDSDGVCDDIDICPGFDDAQDADGDGVPDGCDVCPGSDDLQDSDGDGTADCVDPCPLDNPDDSDADGVCDSTDACPGFDDNVDTDGDGVPDGCDACEGFDDSLDSDNDGTPDGCDKEECDGVDNDGDGVVDEDCVQIPLTTTQAKSAEVLAYPVPSDGSVEFEYSFSDDVTETVSIVVRDFSNKIVYSGSGIVVGEEGIDISSLASGTYVATITSEQTGEVLQVKIIRGTN